MRTSPFRRATRPLAVAVLALLASVAGAFQGEEPYDFWYVLEIDGARAGWYHERVEVTGDRIATTTDTSMSMRRGPDTITIGIESTFHETDRHQPVTWVTKVSMANEPVERVYSFVGDGVVDVVTVEGGRRSHRVADAPDEPWLTPAGVREFTSTRLAAGAEQITYSSLDPMQPLTPVRTTLSGFEPATVEVLGRTVEAIRCEMVSTATPGITSTMYLDEAGRQLRTEIDLGGMRMVTLLADKELALGELDPPELMARTFVRTERPIQRPRRSTEATYLLSVADGELGEIPETSAQRTERIDERTVRVHVRDGRAFDAGLAGEVDPATMATSGMIDWKDERIVELAERAGGGDEIPALRRAELLRRAAHHHIDAKDLGVGFGSASEVVRSRQGDCSEHATLLAALLRAEGIPSRVVSGLIYADGFLGERNIFGYHMWTQALVEVEGERRWVDLDATLGPSDGFDATHIALTISTLSDNEGANALVRLAPLLGRLEVEIETIE